VRGVNAKYAEGIIKKAAGGTMTIGQAPTKLGCTKQYVNKLKRRYASEGSACFLNGNRGRPGPRRTPKETEEAIVSLYIGKYEGFNFSHFREKLGEDEGIKIGYRPLYRILASAGIPSPKEVDFFLSAEYQRKIDNGCSFSLLGKRLQMCDENGETVRATPDRTIDVYVILSGRIVAVWDGEVHDVKDISLGPKEAKPKKPGRPKWRPGPDHPWRRFVTKQK
jgi:transposase